MLQCAGASAAMAGDAMHESLTPTILTTLLTLPIQAWTTFGSLLPPCALAVLGIAQTATTAVAINTEPVTFRLIKCSLLGTV
jgi:hypothetical protein